MRIIRKPIWEQGSPLILAYFRTILTRSPLIITCYPIIMTLCENKWGTSRNTPITGNNNTITCDNKGRTLFPHAFSYYSHWFSPYFSTQARDYCNCSNLFVSLLLLLFSREPSLDGSISCEIIQEFVQLKCEGGKLNRDLLRDGNFG